jgi:hypothetical protein
MTKTITHLFFLCYCLFAFTTNLQAQSNIKYGSNYIVFEAEDTNTPLSNKWVVRKPGDSEFLKYLTNLGTSPAPINNTYLEYIGPWLGASSELEYKFTCQKTGAYRLAMRMHSPLRVGELADKRNDVFIKMDGNFTSANSEISETRARTFTKFYGRGPNKWGSCITLEFDHKHQRPIYNLTEGVEYTFTMKGRSTGVSYDYIALYTTGSWIDQNVDLALQLPLEIRPFINLTGLTLINPTPGKIRVGTTSQLSVAATPANADASVTWSSSNDQIISVNSNGQITAKGSIGTKATITATSTKNNSITVSSEIEIEAFFETPIQSVSVTTNKTAIIVGDELTLNLEVLPTSTHDPSVTWSSTDITIASVDINGKVTGLKEGTVTIRATSNQNNSLHDEVNIQVVAFAAHSVNFDDNNKYKNGTFYNQGNMSVTFNYHAGSLETINKPIKLFFRELNSSWQVQKDVLVEIPEAVGTTSGTLTKNIPLDGLTPTANLPSGNFYYLFVLVESTNGQKVNKGVSPIVILDKTLSVDEEILRNNISFYPNPAKDFVIIESKNLNSSLKAEIYNINGALVQTNIINSKPQKISTSHLNSGIYIMPFKSNNAVTTKKLVIK